MKLTDPRLRVKWCTGSGENSNRIVGVNFQCPCCFKRRLGVKLANPPDGGPPEVGIPEPPDATPEEKERIRRYNLRWQRTGDTFETLSLFPSINVEDEGHWHGFISNGEVTGGGPCGSVS
jgi:hypothetical protein